MFKHLTLKYFLVLFLWLPCVTFAGQNSESFASYTQSWLKEHQVESHIDKDGVLSIPGTTLKINGKVLQAVPKGGNHFLVETQIQITTPNEKKIVENVDGFALTAEDATRDAMSNLCTKILSPVFYAEFIDLKDSHMVRREIEFSGEKRFIYFSDRGLINAAFSAEQLENILDGGVFVALQSLKLDKEIHWGKLTVFAFDNKIAFIEFTLDNEPHEEMTAKLTNLQWPLYDSLYLFTLFFVIGHSN